MVGALFEVVMSKNCTLLWRKAHYEVKMLKKWGSGNTFWSFDVEAVAKSTLWRQNAKKLESGSTFWSSDVEKLHGAVAKRIFSSPNVQNTSWWHFLKFWCPKIARGCGEKHIMKSKCAKHVSSGQFFEVLMSKNCTQLWPEAHLEVKMYKTRQRTGFRSFDVQKLHAVVARSTLAQLDSKGCKTFVPQNTCVLAHSFKFRCPTISQVDQDARLWCFCFIFFVVALFLLVDTTHVCSVRFNQQQKMLFGVTVILMSHNRFSVDVWTKLVCLFWPPVLTFHWVSCVSFLTVSACAE